MSEERPDGPEKWFAIMVIIIVLCLTAILIVNMIYNHGRVDFKT